MRGTLATSKLPPYLTLTLSILDADLGTTLCKFGEDPLWRSADSPLNIADLCPAIPDMGLLYLLAYLLWLFILSRGQGRLWCSRIFVKVRLDVYLVALTLVCSGLDWNFREARGVYNSRTCGWSFSFGWADVVAVRRVGVLYESGWLVCKICVSQICVCGGVICRWTPSWYGNFASD